MISRLSITWRLMLVVLIGAGLVMGLVIAYGYFHTRAILAQELETEAENLTLSTAYRIGTVTKSVEKTVQGLAAAVEQNISDESTWQLLEHAVMNTGEVYGSCFARSPDLQSTSPLVSALYVCRRPHGFAREDLGKQQTYWTEDWFVLPRELDTVVWTEPYFDEGGGNTLMVSCCAPVRDGSVDRAFKGVVTCDVSLEGLDDTVSSLSVAKSGYAFLLSRNGVFISHPSSELILKENIFSWADTIRSPSLRELGRRMIRGESGFVPFTSSFTKEPGWLFFAPVPSTGWTLAVVFPRRALTHKLHQLSSLQSQIAIGGFSALFLVILLISRSITRPIQQLDKATRTLAAGDLDAQLPRIRGADEIAQLCNSFSKMRDELKSYITQLRETVAAKERIQSELRIARDIQISLLPTQIPQLAASGIDLHAVMKPAREVGGDFYDFFLADKHRLCVAIADISGKGVPAALFMAITRSFLRAIFREERSPAMTLKRLNAELSTDNPSCMFATLFCASIDLRTWECRFANGGHNRPMLVGVGGAVEMLPKLRGAPLGAVEDSMFEESTFTLQQGQTLYLYTDGVTEAMNPEMQLFGEERMRDILKTASTRTCATLLDQVQAAVSEFTAGADQSDDLTMLALCRTDARE